MRPNFQLSSTSARGLPGFSTSSLFPSLRLQATRSLTVLFRPCLTGEVAINPALSKGVLRQAQQGRTWGCSCPGPRVDSRDLFVLKQSPYLLFSQCLLYFLVSYLHKWWAAFGCSLFFLVEWVGVPPRCRGKLTPLPPISLPSSLSYVGCI